MSVNGAPEASTRVLNLDPSEGAVCVGTHCGGQLGAGGIEQHFPHPQHREGTPIVLHDKEEPVQPDTVRVLEGVWGEPPLGFLKEPVRWRVSRGISERVSELRIKLSWRRNWPSLREGSGVLAGFVRAVRNLSKEAWVALDKSVCWQDRRFRSVGCAQAVSNIPGPIPGALSVRLFEGAPQVVGEVFELPGGVPGKGFLQPPVPLLGGIDGAFLVADSGGSLLPRST